MSDGAVPSSLRILQVSKRLRNSVVSKDLKRTLDEGGLAPIEQAVKGEV